MAVIQISRIQHRRGLQQDLPNLASAELGWSIDSQKLYIGNGTIEEGAPALGRTEILTEHSDILAIASLYTFKGTAGNTDTVTGVNANNPVVRTLQDKLDDFVNVKDFGAGADGVSDDTDAIQRALDNTFSLDDTPTTRTHRRVYFPAGKYKITGTINVPPGVTLIGDGRAMTRIINESSSTAFNFVDSNGNSGSGVAGFGTGSATGSEYFISHMEISSIHSTGPRCISITGGENIIFDQVTFSGKSTFDTSTDGGTGVAAVYIYSQQYNIPVKNVIFHQCQFKNHNYGLQVETVTNIKVDESEFQNLYNGIVITDLPGTVLDLASFHDVFFESITNEKIVDNGSDYIALGGSTATGVNGIRLGAYQQTMSGTITLTDNTTADTSIVVSGTNTTIDYVMSRDGEVRTGFVRAVNLSGTTYLDEEYTESADLGVTLSFNGDTLSYTTTSTGNDVTLTYNTRNFN